MFTPLESICEDYAKFKSASPKFKIKFKGKKVKAYASYLRWLRTFTIYSIWWECDSSFPFKRDRYAITYYHPDPQLYCHGSE